MDPTHRARPTAIAHPRRPRAGRVGSRLVALGLVAAALILAVTGCVGARGRNDDPVAPGSDGRPRLTIPVRVEAAAARPHP